MGGIFFAGFLVPMLSFGSRSYKIAPPSDMKGRPDVFADPHILLPDKWMTECGIEYRAINTACRLFPTGNLRGTTYECPCCRDSESETEIVRLWKG